MEHTFVICAYKESPYLENCIESLKMQTLVSDIIMTTSTPNRYIRDMADKYNISLYVREGKPDIAMDWNYSLTVARTPYVTIAHQDDIYEPDYAQSVMLHTMQCEQKGIVPIILFTDYSELVVDKKYSNRKNLKIKRLLLHPLKKVNRQHKKVWKRHILRFGNAICCPSVTYNMKYIKKLLKDEQREYLFKQKFRSNLDWQTWEWLSFQEGAFVYIPEVLMAHRIHEQSETTATIQEHLRNGEDYEIFCRFWPKWIAKIITRIYSESEKSNQIN